MEKIKNIWKNVTMFLRNYGRNVVKFILRHSVWFLLILIPVSFFFQSNLIMFCIFYISLAEGLALNFSNLGVHSFTKYNFLKAFDKIADDRQERGAYLIYKGLCQIANAIVIAFIYLGVHILVGYAMYGIFLAAK